MSTQDSLRIDRVSLTNFRCFRECSIDLHPQLTVLVANNGQGKTAVLDAMAIALGLYVHTLDPDHNQRGDVSFVGGDVRSVRDDQGGMKPHTPVSITASGFVDGKRCAWTRQLNKVSHLRTADSGAKAMISAAESVLVRLDNYSNTVGAAAPVLPVVACYGTSRLWSESRLTEERRRVSADQSKRARTAGYLDCLAPTSSFKTFAVWYETMMTVVRGGTPGRTTAGTVSGVMKDDRPEVLVAAVEQAVRVVLAPTGWGELDWDFERKLLTVSHRDHGRLPVAFLSDGVRTMIALVADLAHRCVRLNPQFGVEAAQMTPGVMLVDEVDMHLHPSWQQTVVGLLRKAFPRLQIILTTHSPQVLSAVDAESIRVLSLRDGDGVLNNPTYQTRGVASADILAEVMGVNSIPAVEEALWLSEYKARVEEGADQSEVSLALWSRLQDHFGEDHPVLRDVQVLQRLQEFKRRRNLKT